MSADEYNGWREFYAIDPWGDQRDDLRAARLICAVLAPHMRQRLSPADYLLFPDEANDLEDGLTADEEAWKLRLSRAAG